MGRSRTLTARALRRALAERLPLDAELRDGFSLYDVHPGSGDSVALELVRDGEMVVVEVLDAATAAPVFDRTRHLALRHRAGDVDEAIAADLCRAVSVHLRALEEGLGDAELPAPTDMHDAYDEPLGVEVDLRRADEDEVFLRDDFDGFETFYGRRPKLLELTAARGCFSVRFPAVDEALVPMGAHLHEVPRSVVERRALREYFAALGFAVDADRRVRTVPTPGSWTELMKRAGLPGRGLTPRFVRPRSHRLRGPAWVSHLLDGTLPVSVARPFEARAFARWVPRRMAPYWHPDVGMLWHDVGVHGFVLHRVESHVLADLAARIRRLFPLRIRTGLAITTVSAFYEEDLTRRCQEIWRCIDWPHEFDARFAAELEAIVGDAEARRDGALLPV